VETGKKPWKWGRKSSGKGKWNGIWKKLSIAAFALQEATERRESECTYKGLSTTAALFGRSHACICIVLIV
jgi:hypothetical protein